MASGRRDGQWMRVRGWVLGFWTSFVAVVCSHRPKRNVARMIRERQFLGLAWERHSCAHVDKDALSGWSCSIASLTWRWSCGVAASGCCQGGDGSCCTNASGSNHDNKARTRRVSA
ncbi:uncharacterized protein B0I36DRAFT_145868 [Microdochium trichocladiopsis]|uniref:Uncharacterized protein n=1 Tax=Microdochium trichocladiopsis TaxID=1682393 RepID=A0A9P9BNY9_9PEZI|nr:uncharacterized protein B0I36DRAFT_145868 [Microdochium trichocladiopsis]KAH7027969.1 hypothetical protein B0I36DRAFT_145868 [Microdochium trichocladiopsis]